MKTSYSGSNKGEVGHMEVGIWTGMVTLADLKVDNLTIPHSRLLPGSEDQAFPRGTSFPSSQAPGQMHPHILHINRHGVVRILVMQGLTTREISNTNLAKNTATEEAMVAPKTIPIPATTVTIITLVEEVIMITRVTTEALTVKGQMVTIDRKVHGALITNGVPAAIRTLKITEAVAAPAGSMILAEVVATIGAEAALG